MLLKGEALKRLTGKCVEVLLNEVGGNPRALELLDRIACQEFKEREFTWEELKELIPELRERLIHKASKEDDFTPLFLGRLFGYLTEPQRRVLDVLSVYRNPLKKEALEAHDINISRADRRGWRIFLYWNT
jgi:hypothetical protein